jgi:hypothetical protein
VPTQMAMRAPLLPPVCCQYRSELEAFPSNSLLYSWKNLGVFPVPTSPSSRSEISQILRKVHQSPHEAIEVFSSNLLANETLYQLSYDPIQFQYSMLR